MRDLIDRDKPIVSARNFTKINGNTTINHQIRAKLSISCDLFVFIDCIHKLSRDSKIVTYEAIYEKTGFDIEQCINFFNLAIMLDLVEPSTNALTVFRATETWIRAFNPEEDEFETFWKSMEIIVKGQKKLISWKGSKHDALMKYTKVRQVESFDYLMKQKESYFNMIANSSFRQVMGCSVFLNPQTKRYMEDWSTYSDTTDVPRASTTVKLNSKDVKNLFNG
jgi:hypothetical protein